MGETPDLFPPDPRDERLARMETLFRRIEDATLIPDSRVEDLDWLRTSVSLAHLWAGAGLLTMPGAGGTSGLKEEDHG